MIITLYDYILLPVYFGIFYFFVKKRAATFENIDLKKIFLIAFFLRMLGSIAYSMLVQYYYGYGDSFTYYAGSDFMHNQIANNIGNVKYFFSTTDEFSRWFNAEDGSPQLAGYLAISSATIIVKISAFFSFLSFNKFIIISMFFGLFSFAGQWKLFSVFNDFNKGKNQTLLAYAVLYSPSIWFWGSGLMKDSICLGAVGFIVAIFYKTIVKKQINFAELLMLPLLIFLVYVVKSYIVLVLLASIVMVIFVHYVLLLKNLIVKIGVIILFLTLGVLFITFSNFSTQINEMVEDSYMQVQSYQQNYQNIQNADESSKAGFELDNFDPSLSSMILKSPGAIFSCLYRPFLWESRKVIILFTALESTLLLLSTLYLLIKTRFVGFFKIIFLNPLILFSFVASILFALIIGFTTFNFGTMIRYKIILLPFYYFMLVSIYSKTGKKVEENPILS